MTCGVITRGPIPSDRNFILESWVKSFMRSQDTGPIPVDIYYDTYRQVVERVLSRATVKVLVSADGGLEPPYEIHGYLVYETGPHWKGNREVEKTAVHFLYIKEMRRRQGVARSLLRAAEMDPMQPFFFTFRTPDARAILRERHWQGEYHPNIVKYTKTEKDKR